MIWLKIKKLLASLKKNLKGISLAEIIVSMFIFALLTAIFLANYRGSEKRSGLINTVQKAVSDIRLAQSYTMGSKEYNTAVPAGGWGAYFDTQSYQLRTQYIIFADANGDKVYSSGEADEAYGGKTINLPTGATIQEVRIDGTVRDRVYITFEPPDPRVNICRSTGGGTCGNNTIIIFSDGVSQKRVNVNIFGLVDSSD